MRKADRADPQNQSTDLIHAKGQGQGSIRDRQRETLSAVIRQRHLVTAILGAIQANLAK